MDTNLKPHGQYYYGNGNSIWTSCSVCERLHLLDVFDNSVDGCFFFFFAFFLQQQSDEKHLWSKSNLQIRAGLLVT